MEHAATLSRYPPNEGIPELRHAISDWLARRYGVPEAYRDPDTQIFPLNGTREGLFNACLALGPEQKNGRRPAVLLPNPFYQCYAVAAVTAGAEPVYLPCGPRDGLPAGLRGAAPRAARPHDGRLHLLARQPAGRRAPTAPGGSGCCGWPSGTTSSSSPTSAIARSTVTGRRPARWRRRRRSASIRNGWSASTRCPSGRTWPGCARALRVTGPGNSAKLLQLRAYAGAPLPIPAQHAAAACWADEAHVEANRALYREKYAHRRRDPGQRARLHGARGRVLPVARRRRQPGGGEAAALRLWREAGVRALPGAYLSRPVSSAFGGGDPGRATCGSRWSRRRRRSVAGCRPCGSVLA